MSTVEEMEAKWERGHLRGWDVTAWQDWSSWFHIRDFNWSTFEFVRLYVESTRYRGMGCDTIEIHVALLGFNLLVERYKPERTPIVTPEEHDHE